VIKDKAVLERKAIVAPRREFSCENEDGICFDEILVLDDEGLKGIVRDYTNKAQPHASIQVDTKLSVSIPSTL